MNRESFLLKKLDRQVAADLNEILEIECFDWKWDEENVDKTLSLGLWYSQKYPNLIIRLGKTQKIVIVMRKGADILSYDTFMETCAQEEALYFHMDLWSKYFRGK